MTTLIWVECEVAPYRHEVALLSGPAKPGSKESYKAWEEKLKAFIASEFWASFKRFEKIEVIENAYIKGSDEDSEFKCLVRYIHPCTLDMTRKKNFQKTCFGFEKKQE